MKIINFSKNLLDCIAEIEKQSYTTPWSKEMFLESARNRAVKFKVLTENETVVGYYVISITAGETEILNITVNPAFRRRSFGKAILEDIKKESIKGMSDFIFLETRQNNTAALSLYKSFGFEKIGIRKKYYKNEDALILKLSTGLH
jgi:ribosomal-protein-alanine N-acetyltransferase